jgi:hypothetical protein
MLMYFDSPHIGQAQFLNFAIFSTAIGV